MTMKKALSIWCFPGGTTIEQAMKQAKAAGFDGIELAVGEGGELTPETPLDQVKRFRDLAGRIGIEISSFASGLGWKYQLTSADPQVAERAREIHRRGVAMAAALGADVLLSVPGAVNETVSYAEAWDRSVAAYRELAPAAEKAGVVIGIENVWNKFLLSPLEMVRIIDEIDRPFIQCYFDAGNVLVFGYPQHWIRSVGSRIRKVHIKDFKLDIGNIRGFTTLLNGSVPWPEVMKALREIGYDDYLVAEVGPPNPAFPNHLIEETSAAMTKILSI